jgi:hypothetical protein
VDAPEKSSSGEESEFGRRCHGVYKRKRESFIPTNVLDILFIPNIPAPFSTTHLADNDWRGGGQKGCLVMFVSKMHRRAPGLYRALDGRTMISLKSMNASPIILVNQSASSRTSMQMCARKYMESSGVPG